MRGECLIKPKQARGRFGDRSVQRVSIHGSQCRHPKTTGRCAVGIADMGLWCQVMGGLHQVCSVGST